MTRICSAYHRQQHRDLGESLRWLKALHCRCYDPVTRACDPTCACGHDQQGMVYIEQALDPLFKALFSQTRQALVDPQFGLIEVNSLRISVLPDELPLARLDRVILIERQLTARPVLVRGTGMALDALTNTPVVAVQSIQQDTTTYAPGVDWQLNGNSIEWLPGGQAPAAGSRYRVEHTYQPTYSFLGLEDNTTRCAPGAAPLPMCGVLSLIAN